jgi:hypothetical protein
MVRFFALQVLIQELRMDNALTRIIFFDKFMDDLLKTDMETVNWPALYPFQEKIVRDKTGIEYWQKRLSGIEEKIESYTKEYLINRLTFIEWVVKYEKLAGWNILNADIFDLGDGHLTEVVK